MVSAKRKLTSQVGFMFEVLPLVKGLKKKKKKCKRKKYGVVYMYANIELVI